MKTDSPKFWVRNKYVNRIKHRALDKYESRSPQFYAHGIVCHDSWEEAFKANVLERKQALQKAQQAVARAERQLAKALVMVKPEA